MIGPSSHSSNPMRPYFLLLMLLPVFSPAATTLETDYSGSSANMQGGARLSQEYEGDYAPELGAGYSRTRTFGATGDAYSSSLDLSLDGKFSKELSGSFSFTWNRDDTNAIYNVQPDLGLTWRWLGEADEEGERPIYLKVAVGSGIAFYSMEVLANSVGRFGRTRTAKTTLTLNQITPRIKVSVPLFSEDFTPYVSYTDYSYNRDPIEMVDAAHARLPQGVVLGYRLDALSSQLLYRAWAFGGSLNLPLDMTLSGSYGRQQSVSPDLTSNIVQVDLDADLTKWLSVSGGWTRYFGDGDPLDSANTSVSLTF